LPQN